MNSFGYISGWGGALSSISVPTERAPPLSNSLNTIYLDLLVFVYCINFLYHCINFFVTSFFNLRSLVTVFVCIVRINYM